MPGPLLTRKDISSGAVSFQPRQYDTKVGKAISVRVFFSWGTADSVMVMPHALGKVPTGIRPVSTGSASGGAPTISSGSAELGSVLSATKSVIALKSNLANSFADIEVF
jgi:hypothetical protein